MLFLSRTWSQRWFRTGLTFKIILVSISYGKLMKKGGFLNSLNILWHCPALGLELAFLQSCGHCWVFQIWCWSGNSNTLANDAKSQLIGKDPDAEKDWRQKEKRAAKDEMARQHHWPHGHESEQTLGDSEGQGSLACYIQSVRSQRVRHNSATEQPPPPPDHSLWTSVYSMLVDFFSFFLLRLCLGFILLNITSKFPVYANNKQVSTVLLPTSELQEVTQGTIRGIFISPGGMLWEQC